MENEEITTNVAETETNNEEITAESTDTSLPDENTGISDVEDSQSVLPNEQGEENGSDAESDLEETGLDNDVVSTDEEETGRTFTQEELEQIITALMADENETETQSEETAEIPRTLFNTPLDEYTVSEGLLVCIFLLILANFVHSIFKGSHWFGKL